MGSEAYESSGHVSAFQLVFIITIRFQTEHRAHAPRPVALVFIWCARSIILGITIMFFSALRLMPLAEATTLSLMSQLITALSTRLFAGEYVGPRRWFWSLVGVV